MNGELERAQREISAARAQLRRAHRRVTQLAAFKELGRYELDLHEPLNVGELVQFLRLAITGATSRIVIVVSQPPEGPDSQGEPDGQDV